MKQGRNEMCNCGSGKKFKKCCIHNSKETSHTPDFRPDKQFNDDLVVSFESPNGLDVNLMYLIQNQISNCLKSIGLEEVGCGSMMDSNSGRIERRDINFNWSK
tara:strand:+ start:122 stop:430 length:309 start_codon:yes stop_codon:yes gene_type:complete